MHYLETDMIISETIKEGIISEVRGRKAVVKVSCDDDACNGCKMQPACRNKKDITSLTARNDGCITLSPGDKVIVIGRIKGWFTSWLLLAALPCVAIITALITGFAIGLRDGIVGTLAIAVTIVYYIVLWFFRKRLNRKVEWIITDKIQQ